jgi:hypothetical protein
LDNWVDWLSDISTDSFVKWNWIVSDGSLGVLVKLVCSAKGSDGGSIGLQAFEGIGLSEKSFHQHFCKLVCLV